MRLSEQLAQLDPEQRTALAARLAPLPAIQRRLWTATQLAPDPALYNVVDAYRLRGTLDSAALRGALDALYRRHGGLRTAVVDLDDLPRVVRLPETGGFPFEEHDVCAEPANERHRIAERLVARASLEPFDLANGPLVRGVLVRCAAREWLFAIVMHHLVCDGESMRVLFGELAALYGGADPTGLPAVIDPVAAARALESLAGTERRAADLNYWRRHLDGAPARTELPTDGILRYQQRHSGARVAIPLGAGWSDGVRGYAADQGTSLFAAALATLATVLTRFGQLTEVTIGTTVNMRADARAEGAVGFFMRTVPLRVRVDQDARFTDLVRDAHDVVVGALTHGSVEFDDIVAALGRSSGASAPLFQVALELHEDDVPIGLAGLVQEPLLVGDCAAKFDLSFHLSTGAGGSAVEYSTELYGEQTARGLAEAVAVALTALAGRYQGPVGELPILSAAGRQRAAALSVGEPLPAGGVPLPVAVRTWAAAHPTDRAVIAADAAGSGMDYQSLVARADSLASDLRRRGVGAGTPVGMCMRRSPEQIPALFGVWFAGATCVPLDPQLPEARLRTMLRMLGVAVVVTDARTGAHPAFTDLVRCTVPAVPVGDLPDAAPSLAGSDPAYVIFTSGSSGLPKPVVVRHDSLTAFGAAMDHLGLDRIAPGAVVAANAPLHFDASLQHIQLLRRGHPVLIVDEEHRTDADALLDLINRHDVWAIDGTPTHVEALVAAGLLEPGRSRLRTLVMGGEAVRPSLWRRLRESHLEAVNVYGPTEFTVNATGCVVDGPYVTIGRPLAGVRVEILDERMRPVPAGFPGELHLSGRQIALGYQSQPARTAEQFRPAPGGGRRYATGDLGRWRPDGDIEFRGRADEQVKLRGYRIDLTEVESALRGADRVIDAAVTVLRADGLAPVLAAMLVPATGTGAAITVPDSRAAITAAGKAAAAQLPPYMVPTVFVTSEALPTTRSGKLDRRGLTAMVERQVAAQGTGAPDVAGGDAPDRQLTGTQRRLAKLWEELTGHPVTDPGADFFAIGGNSLMFTALLRRIAREFGRSVSVHAAIRARTLAAMSQVVDAAGLATAPADPGGRAWSPTPDAPADRALAVPLASGDGPPLVLLHPLGGTLLCYGPLMRVLPPGRAVWGVRSPSVAGCGAEPRHVAELIGRYRDELLRRFAPGPVALAGWSLGGLLAVALAAALERAGCGVRFVEVWDCGLGTADEYDAAELLALAKRAAYGDEPAPADTDPEAVDRALVTLTAQTRLFRDWCPRPFDAPLRVVYASESLRGGVVTRTDWGPYAHGGWTERVVEADHHGIVRFPVVAQTAANLIASLDHEEAAG